VSSEHETFVDETAEGPAVIEEEELPPPPPSGPPPRAPLLWPWLLLLLILVIGGLIAAWLLTRDSGSPKKHAVIVAVPNVVGLKESQAVAKLGQAGLVSHIRTKTSSLPAGTVFAEQPSAGSRVTRGSAVTLVTSVASVVVMPNVVGEKAAAAVKALHAKGLTVETSRVVSSKPDGTVVSQSPGAGSKVAKGSTAAIRISHGLVTVPDTVGQNSSVAVRIVRAAGLVPRLFSVPSQRPKGSVVAQYPVAGARAERGSIVRLNIAKASSIPPPAPGTTDVPDVTGKPQDQAQQQLQAAAFEASVVYVSSGKPAGTVVSQSPVGGTPAKRDTRVQLKASLGPNPGPQQIVPNVIGLSPGQAEARLRAAGFDVQQLPQTVQDRSKNGIIVDEQPGPGKKAPAGSTVTIYVGNFFET
jgi:beta-lactam-binding protein with PASTA domain